MPTADGKKLREKITEGAEKVEDDEMGQNEWEVVSSIRLYVSPSLSDTELGYADRSRSIPDNQRDIAERMQGTGKNRDDVVCRHRRCMKSEPRVSYMLYFLGMPC